MGCTLWGLMEGMVRCGGSSGGRIERLCSLAKGEFNKRVGRFKEQKRKSGNSEETERGREGGSEEGSKGCIQ